MSKKKNRQHNNTNQVKSAPLVLRHIEPLTDTQRVAFDAYKKGQHLVLHGFAGTGKTFLSLYLALNELLRDGTYYDKIIILRSVVPSRDMGFLPGTMKEKARVYEEPYMQICNELFGKPEYEALKARGSIVFSTTSYLRGITFNNAIVIVDEAQNLNHQEMYTTLTRVGNNSRAIVIGDFRQCDLKQADTSLLRTISILKSMSSVSLVEFGKEDIVRSGFVKEFIIKSTEHV